MKVLFVGASGMVGSHVLTQCLSNPNVSSVVAFVRKDLPTNVWKHPKLTSVIMRDFGVWEQNVLEEHQDAAAMVWTMGSYNGSVPVDLEYPLTFLESMLEMLEAKRTTSAQRFRFVLLGGKFVRQDQDTSLWFLEKPRKIKGLLETRSLALADGHPTILQTLIVKPGGIVTNRGGFLNTLTSLGAIMGKDWSVRAEELAAFMTYLAIDGRDEEPISENGRIVTRGRELLLESSRKK